MTDARRLSLRAELLGESQQLPAFGLLLPRGWQLHRTPGGVDQRLNAVLAGFTPEQRTAFQRAMTAAAGPHPQVRPQDFGLIATIEQEPNASPVPLSFTISWLHAPPGATIEGVAAEAIASKGARPLGDDGSMLRWVDDQRTRVEGGSIRTISVAYLARVPAERRRALLIRSTILAEADGHVIPEEGITAMTALSDGIAATLRWKRRG